MYKRDIKLNLKTRRTFFLWGPRLTGKSTLLRERYPAAKRYDLLNTDLFIRLQRSPHLLREQLEASPPSGPVLIDEIQKVPALLDEVHWLIENRGLIFGLCGSSARKVRRGHANLLGGRADRFELHPLIRHELGNEFSLEKALNNGLLPSFYPMESAARAIRSYCADYLKEEIAAEGLVRNLPAFTTFLETASLSDTEQVSYTTIARDCGVSAPAVKGYFELLVDTLMASFLPSYQKRPKRRIVQAPKFYFFDVGVVNHLARRGSLKPGSELYGKAMENWFHHELRAHRAYTEKDHAISYWRLSTGIEVDFILGEMECAVEVKASANIHSDHLKGLRELKKDQPRVKHRVVACLEKTPRKTDDGILILPYAQFLDRLWGGEWI